MHFKRQDLYAQPNPFMPSFTSPYPALAQQNYSYMPLNALSYPHSLIAASRERGQGKWTSRQQKLYIDYLQKHMADMKDKVSRKTNKVFLKMSRIVWTRSPDQCRSHHQKILKSHNSLQNIISTFKRRFAGQEGQKILEKTGADDESIQGFYKLRQRGNSFTIHLDESAIQIYRL